MSFDAAKSLRALVGQPAHCRRVSEAAATEIDRLRLENAELRACFNAATVDWSFEQVNKVITDAKNYVSPKNGT